MNDTVSQHNPNPQDEIPEEMNRFDPYSNDDGCLEEILTFVELLRTGVLAHEASNPIVYEPGYPMPGFA